MGVIDLGAIVRGLHMAGAAAGVAAFLFVVV